MQEQDPADDRQDAVTRLMAENDRLRSILLNEDVAIKRMTYTPEDGLDVELEHWAVRLFASHLADSLFAGRNPKDANFITMTLVHPDYGPIEVTIRKAQGGKTPADRIAELEADNAHLRERVIALEARG